MQGIVLSICLLATVIVPGVYVLECRDENNNAVDWFIVYKTPDNLNYWYLTPAHVKWTKSLHTLDQSAGTIFNTLNQVYTSNVFAMFYNDKFGEATYNPLQLILHFIRNLGATKYGHMKGVLSMEHSKQGFWFVHSVPQFVPKTSYAYPSNGGNRQAQTMFCTTFPYSQLTGIVQQLLITMPHVYHYRGDAAIEADLPDVVRYLSKNAEKPGLKHLSRKVLTSKAGVPFLHMAKSRRVNMDIYTAMASAIKTPLLVETRRDGSGDLPSTKCSPGYRVENIEAVKLANVTFDTTVDNSKWVVSSVRGSPWVCGGDADRQQRHLARGGGLMCMKSAALWSAYRPMVVRYEACKNAASLY